MEISQITLAVMLLYSFLFGIAVGILYDVNRIVRVLFGVRYTNKAYSRLYSLKLPISKNNLIIGSNKGFWQSLVINLGDVFCVIIATVGVILINYGYNSGRFRFFTVAALIVGFVIYRFSIGRILILVAEPIAFFCKYIFLSICDLLALPLRKTIALVRKFVKKISSLYIFTLENKTKKLYNIRDEVFLSDGVEKDASDIEKNKRWKYRKGESTGGKE